MAKDPVTEVINNYQKHLHLVLQNLSKMFSDEKVSSEISKELKSRAASMYLAISELGRAASLANGQHLAVLSQNIQEFMKQIPEEEITAAQFSEVLKSLNPDVVIKMDIGNC